MMRFDRFTDSAQKSAQLSSKIIQRYGHDQIDTEHLLLAMIEEPNSGIPKIMANLSVNSKTLIEQLDAELRISPLKNNSTFPGQNFITPRIKRVIDLANEEANRLQDEDISTEHIFLAILTEWNTPAARVLASAGLTRGHVYSAIQQMRKSQPIAQHTIKEIRSQGYENKGISASDIHRASDAMRFIEKLIYGRSISSSDESAALSPSKVHVSEYYLGTYLYEVVEPAITYLTYVPLDKSDKSGDELPPEDVIRNLIRILAGTGDKRAIPALTRIANTERKIRKWKREDTGGHPIEVEQHAYLASNDYERAEAKAAIEIILNQRYETCPRCNGNRTFPCSSCAGTGEGWSTGETKVMKLFKVKTREKSKCSRCDEKKVEACRHCRGYGKLIMK